MQCHSLSGAVSHQVAASSQYSNEVLQQYRSCQRDRCAAISGATVRRSRKRRYGERGIGMGAVRTSATGVRAFTTTSFAAVSEATTAPPAAPTTPPITAPLVFPPSTRPTTAPPAAPTDSSRRLLACHASAPQLVGHRLESRFQLPCASRQRDRVWPDLEHALPVAAARLHLGHGELHRRACRNERAPVGTGHVLHDLRAHDLARHVDTRVDRVLQCHVDHRASGNHGDGAAYRVGRDLGQATWRQRDPQQRFPRQRCSQYLPRSRPSCPAPFRQRARSDKGRSRMCPTEPGCRRWAWYRGTPWGRQAGHVSAPAASCPRRLRRLWLSRRLRPGCGIHARGDFRSGDLQFPVG